MNLGKMTLSEAMKYLKPVAEAYGLKLYKVKDFQTAKFIVNHLYNSIS